MTRCVPILGLLNTDARFAFRWTLFLPAMKYWQRRSLRLVITLLLLPSIIISASAQLDSLPRLLAKADWDIGNEECALVCESIALTYSRKDMWLPALSWIDRAITQSADSLALSRFYRKKCLILSRLQSHHQILEAAQRARNFGGPRISPSELHSIYTSEGVVFTFTGRYEEAFRHTYDALLLAIANNDSIGFLYSTANLGMIYYKVRDYRTAVEYYKKSLEGIKRDDFQFPLASSNLALAYAHANRPEDALACLRQIKKEALTGFDAIQFFYTLGIASHYMDQPDSALFHFSKSLQLSVEQDNKRYIAENYLVIAEINISRGDTAVVSKYLARAEEYATEYKYEDIIVKVYEQQMNLAEQLHANSHELVALQSKFIRKKIELYNTNLSQLLARRKSQHFEREYRVAMTRQNYLLQANLESERAQALFNYIFCCLLVLSGILLVLLIFSIRTRRRHKLNLEKIINKRSEFIAKRVHDLDAFVSQIRFSISAARKILLKSLNRDRFVEY